MSMRSSCKIKTLKWIVQKSKWLKSFYKQKMLLLLWPAFTLWPRKASSSSSSSSHLEEMFLWKMASEKSWKTHCGVYYIIKIKGRWMDDSWNLTSAFTSLISGATTVEHGCLKRLWAPPLSFHTMSCSVGGARSMGTTRSEKSVSCCLMAVLLNSFRWSTNNLRFRFRLFLLEFAEEEKNGETFLCPRTLTAVCLFDKSRTLTCTQIALKESKQMWLLNDTLGFWNTDKIWFSTLQVDSSLNHFQSWEWNIGSNFEFSCRLSLIGRRAVLTSNRNRCQGEGPFLGQLDCPIRCLHLRSVRIWKKFDKLCLLRKRKSFISCDEPLFE